MRIAIIGAGVIGLSTATVLQSHFKDADITIIADKLNKNTLSDGSAGLFRPSHNVKEEYEKEIYRNSFAHFLRIFQSEEAGEYGVQMVSGYIIAEKLEFVADLWYKDLVLDFHFLDSEELKKLNLNKKYGCFFTSTVTECRKYLPKLLKKFLNNNGHVILAKINGLHEINKLPYNTEKSEYNFVINCAGLNAGQIINDKSSMIPIKGQVIRINAPWIKNFWFLSESLENDFKTYIIPTTQTVVLGATRDEGVSDDTVCPEDSEAIMQRCAGLVPSVKLAPILTEWAGLRPYRKETLHTSSPRIELEPLKCLAGNFDFPQYLAESRTIVIHNYGHGGNGVSMSYGSGLRVLELMENYLVDNKDYDDDDGHF
ncbi:unnamed protein product [Gordionus sp. m RMFG-2023]